VSANLVVDDLFGGEGAGVFGEPDAYAEVWREREDWLAGREGAAAVKRCRGRGGRRRRRWPVPVDPDPDPEAPEAVVERFAAVDEAVTEALRGRVREARGSLLAAGAMALALSAVEDPDQTARIAVDARGREAAAEQAVVGWFANEAVIRLPARTGTILEYATALRGEIFAALSDQRVPFELLGGALPEGTPDGPSCGLVFLPAGLSGAASPSGDSGRGRHPDRDLDLSDRRGIDFFLIEDAPPMGSPRAPRSTVRRVHVACHRRLADTGPPAPTLDGDAGRARRPPLGRHAARRRGGADGRPADALRLGG